MNFFREDWEKDAAAKWFDSALDTPTDLEPPVYGWIFVTQTSFWEQGYSQFIGADADPYEKAFRVYEDIRGAMEEIGPYCERVEMTQIARIRLSGKVYRPSRRACPYRVFHGTNATCLWTANPTTVLHDFALMCVQDVLDDFPSVADFVKVKQRYLDGEITWQALWDIDHKLNRLRYALGSDARYAATQVLMGLFLERRPELAAREAHLQAMLLALKPEGALDL